MNKFETRNLILERLADTLTIEEEKAVLSIIREARGQKRVPINASYICRQEGISRSMFTSTIRILELIGMFDTRSMGSKGTMLSNINNDYIEEFMERYGCTI